MSKYGLNLRPQQKKQPARPPLPTALGFGNDDDDDVEKEISRHASKNKSLKDIEEQQRKALEEDPSAFDYDGVYDEMKAKTIQPKAQDRQERKPKYIQNLLRKAEGRQREQEIVYERKLAKERSQEDHLYADKEKFVTSAYKKKLAEQAKWMEEERLRQLREEKDDVTKKTDLSDFYFNLGKNVAFGAKDLESRKQEKPAEVLRKPDKDGDGATAEALDRNRSSNNSNLQAESSKVTEERRSETYLRKQPSELSDMKPVSDSNAKPVSDKAVAVQENSPGKDPTVEQPKRDHHKRGEDAVSAARERFLARKRAKQQKNAEVKLIFESNHQSCLI